MSKVDTWLSTLVSSLELTDRALADEIRAVERARSLAGPDTPSVRTRRALRRARVTVRKSVRNIILRVGRPVLAVAGSAAVLDLNDTDSTIWRSRLQAAAVPLQRVASAVGRIDTTDASDRHYLGTGWLAHAGTIVTNRHVARELTRRSRRSGSALGAIDFLEEVGRPERLVCPIVEILQIEEDDGPDVAFLRIEGPPSGRSLGPPIQLAKAAPARGQQVAVIGYPAKDSRASDAALMQSIFGDVYEKKRLAPGQVIEVRPDVMLHDCSTLGGNSGSVVVDLETGHAVGLHYAGRFLEANYAVPAELVADRLDRVLHPRPGRPPVPVPVSHDHPPPHATIPPPAAGEPSTGPELIVEGVPSDYVGRQGYDAGFLGFPVPLPVIADAADVLTFEWEGEEQTELKYEHFSVVMSRSRRLCVLSAVNIEGATPRRFKRPSWRFDPRIPSAQQIRDECYGSEPLFSRGHMTRREDPIWGDPDDAARGNSDSMHVTNTVPQMQPFNAGIWLGLESYALENAREDRMRISVFTGPFFLDDDPVVRGVRIPRSFWKVITFVHDETGELCATGYTMSQEQFLLPDEFVFGQHKTAQVRIASIETRAGLSFGTLAALDPFEGDDEGVEHALIDPSQIRFVRRPRTGQGRT